MNSQNCEFKCNSCGLSRKDPHYNALYRSRYGHKPCFCRCHSPFSPGAKGLFSDSPLKFVSKSETYCE